MLLSTKRDETFNWTPEILKSLPKPNMESFYIESCDSVTSNELDKKIGKDKIETTVVKWCDLRVWRTHWLWRTRAIFFQGCSKLRLPDDIFSVVIILNTGSSFTMIWKYSIRRKQLEETLQKHSFKALWQTGWINISMNTRWETEVICPISILKPKQN